MKLPRGFTLVEVLVVLTIIGISIGLVTLGFQRLENDQLTTSAGRMAGWLQTVSDDAVLDGIVYGISFGSKKGVIQRYYYLKNRWWAVKDDDLDPPQIPDGMLLYEKKGKPWKEVQELSSEKDYQPNMVFLPVGSTIPEQLYMEDTATNRTALIKRDTHGLFIWQFM